MSEPPLSMQFIQPDRSKVVILDRINDVAKPDYCIHGRTKCFGCDQWCHLGSETLKVVESGAATPMCIHCANGVVSKNNLIARAEDHR